MAEVHVGDRLVKAASHDEYFELEGKPFHISGARAWFP
jgi:hypothetical protein